MRFRNRSGELFFLLLACLAQVVTVLACTLWREVVFVPERWKGPPLTQEYLVWYLLPCWGSCWWWGLCGCSSGFIGRAQDRRRSSSPW